MHSGTRSAHLRQLEAQSVFIMREAVAELRNPVMLYSIGKDSSVLLHIAQKAFFPAKPPFPLLHIDTTWKFKEMIAFRDATAAAQTLVHLTAPVTLGVIGVAVLLAVAGGLLAGTFGGWRAARLRPAAALARVA